MTYRESKQKHEEYLATPEFQQDLSSLDQARERVRQAEDDLSLAKETAAALCAKVHGLHSIIGQSAHMNARRIAYERRQRSSSIL